MYCGDGMPQLREVWGHSLKILLKDDFKESLEELESSRGSFTCMLAPGPR